MTPEGNGRFCNDCSKVVRDFSMLNLDEVNNHILSSKEADACGSFHAYQIDKPFGNWRDVIISYYQRVSLRLKTGSLIKPVTVFLLFLIMLITGCARRLSGRYACAPPHNSQTSQANTK